MKKTLILGLIMLIHVIAFAHVKENTSVSEEYRVTSYYKNYNGKFEKQTIKVRVKNSGYGETIEIIAYMLYDQWYDISPSQAMKVSPFADEDEKQFTYFGYAGGKKCFFNL